MPSAEDVKRDSLTAALATAESKVNADEAALIRARAAARPKPTELQLEMSNEQRQELATEKFLLDGFYKAKLQNQDQEVDLTDVQMIRNLQAVARHMVDRTKNRR